MRMRRRIDGRRKIKKERHSQILLWTKLFEAGDREARYRRTRLAWKFNRQQGNCKGFQKSPPQPSDNPRHSAKKNDVGVAAVVVESTYSLRARAMLLSSLLDS